MGAYAFIAKIRVQQALAYRFDVLSTVALQFIIMISTLFFWVSAYGGKEVFDGVTREQMLTYTIMSAVLTCLFTINVENRIHMSVHRGSVAVDFLKPINVFGIYLAEDLGSIIVSFFQNALPLLIVGSVFVMLPLPRSSVSFLLFLLSAIISYAINWLLSASFGMIAFKVINMGPLSAVKHHAIRLLSGSIIPLWFFPAPLQKVLGFMPFMYIYQLPLSIYIGQINGSELVFQMCVQVIWLAIFAFVFNVARKKSVMNILVQGG